MGYQWSKRDKEIRQLMAVATDYLRYTFTPSFSLVALIVGLGAFATVTAMFYRFEPLLAVSIFFGYTGFLLVAMVASFTRWKRYRQHYSVFNKTSRP